VQWCKRCERLQSSDGSGAVSQHHQHRVRRQLRRITSQNGARYLPLVIVVNYILIIRYICILCIDIGEAIDYNRKVCYTVQAADRTDISVEYHGNTVDQIENFTAFLITILF
jgi:hypothetical protein